MTKPVKRQLSQTFRNAIEPILKENRAAFEYGSVSGDLFRLLDVSADSDFFFAVHGESYTSNGVVVSYSCVPRSADTLKSFSSTDTLSTFSVKLKAWFNMIREHASESVFDDPIERAFEREFFDDWRIVDEDADMMPFTFEHQQLLMEYLVEVEDLIADEFGSGESVLKDELIARVVDAREAVTAKSKNAVMHQLTALWAKARKGSLRLASWMLKKFVEKVFSKGIDAAFKYATENSHKLPAYIDEVEGMLRQ